MELASVKQLRKNVWNLLLDYAGAVVFHYNPVFEFAYFYYLDAYFRKHSCFLAGIKGIVNSFLDSHEQCLPLIVEPEQMPVLCEEFSYRNLFLPLGKLVS